ncbi:hypothetical protein [Methylocystis sp. SC2]|uniref:hypothetical protein n=1 Tax=Methylocystis sp. (strain SC2) TaxID=187303 RepID=UPI00130DD626|nr:hypothetical protein [Methylocystis sp. SC2]
MVQQLYRQRRKAIGSNQDDAAQILRRCNGAALGFVRIELLMIDSRDRPIDNQARAQDQSANERRRARHAIQASQNEQEKAAGSDRRCDGATNGESVVNGKQMVHAIADPEHQEGGDRTDDGDEHI